MKKVFLSLLALVATSAVFAQKKLVTETEVSAADATVVVAHNFYDASGNRSFRLVEGVSQTIYTYNALNQVEREDFFNLTDSNKDRTYVYTYNEAGQKASKEEFAGERSLSKETYTYDEHGNILTITPGALPVPIQYTNEYDNDGNLIKYAITFMGRDMGSATYTYENGLLVKSESGNTVTTYTYDETGLLTAQVVTTGEGDEQTVTETSYEYADIDAYFQPQGLQYVVNAGNTVTFTWTSNVNAIVFDGQYVEVEGNSFTTPVLQDGTYTFYVANHGNAQEIDEVAVYDNTKVGVTNIHLNGTITAQTVISLNDNNEEKRTTTYYIPVAWSLAEGSNPIGFRIYYNSNYSVYVEDGTIREYVIPASNYVIYDMAAGGLVTLPFEIKVVAVYATGSADPDQTLPLNTDEIMAISPEVINGITNVTVGELSDGAYTLNGVRVAADVRNLTKGLYIVRKGNKTSKVLVR